MFAARNIHYDMADRNRAIGCGGIGSIHLLACKVGLIDAINRELPLLKVHLPYHESDHELNIAYNVACGGKHLQDLERLRHDEAYLDTLRASRIPDPTTARSAAATAGNWSGDRSGDRLANFLRHTLKLRAYRSTKAIEETPINSRTSRGLAPKCSNSPTPRVWRRAWNTSRRPASSVSLRNAPATRSIRSLPPSLGRRPVYLR
jgi:hypothetical protein